MPVLKMGGAEENRSKNQLSLQTNGFSRDLLQKFKNGNGGVKEEDAENGGIELSLGLSLNGRFGVDPERADVKLKRSSSVANFGSTAEAQGAQYACLPEVDAYAPLLRTCSLPAEAEEEWRRRKEMQSARRMEAKRKRMEKLKNVRVVREKLDSAESGCETNNSSGFSNGMVNGIVHGNGFGIPSSQLSIGSSQGSGSSGLSEFESQSVQGLKQNTETASPASVQSSEQIEQKVETRPANKEAKGAQERIKNAMLDMPCVSTRGDGPNGRSIQGFLYRYKKGEEVKIVCVCHGSFLSPAEFVRHAGGGDVEHPLRHIVVNPSPLL